MTKVNHYFKSTNWIDTWHSREIVAKWLWFSVLILLWDSFDFDYLSTWRHTNNTDWTILRQWKTLKYHPTDEWHWSEDKWKVLGLLLQHHAFGYLHHKRWMPALSILFLHLFLMRFWLLYFILSTGQLLKRNTSFRDLVPVIGESNNTHSMIFDSIHKWSLN